MRFVQEIGHHRVGVPPHDRLQRHLDGQVEVVGEQRLDVVDDLAAVGLEGVRRVVVAVTEEEPDAEVHEAVERQLEPSGSR